MLRLKSVLKGYPGFEGKNKLPPPAALQKLSYCYFGPSRGARSTLPMLSGTPPIDRLLLYSCYYQPTETATLDRL